MNGRVVALAPLFHQDRVLRVGAEQGALAGQTQLGEQASPAAQAQPQTELLLDQRLDHGPCPQSELESVLQRTRAHHRLIDPLHLRPGDLPRAPVQHPGLQRRPAAGPIHGQPTINATPAKPQGRDHHLGALAGLYALHRARSDLFERPMVQLSRCKSRCWDVELLWPGDPKMEIPDYVLLRARPLIVTAFAALDHTGRTYDGRRPTVERSEG